MFVLLFPVVGVALRYDLRVTSCASLAFAISATFLTMRGHGPFATVAYAPTRVLLAQAFITATAAVAFLVVKAVMGLRVTEEQEREGLDITSHGERAYDM